MIWNLVPLALALLRSSSADLGQPLERAPSPFQDAKPEEKKLPHWSGSMNAGMTLTRGNAENFTGAFAADATREDVRDRYIFKGFWNYADQTVNGQKTLTERTAGLNGEYDYFPQPKWYLLGKAGIETNEAANLDKRVYAGPGAGIQFVKSDTTSFSGDTALVYLREEFNDGTDDDKIALNLGYDWKWKFSPTSELDHSLDVFPAVNDFDDVSAKVDTKLTTNLTKSMISSLQYVIDFDHTPAAGAKQTDHRVIFTLGWSFGK